MPNKALELHEAKCHGGKLSKTRIIRLLAANIDGTSKLWPFVVGKSASPRCFKNCNTFPLRYANIRKSSMTLDLFCKWLKDWDY